MKKTESRGTRRDHDEKIVLQSSQETKGEEEKRPRYKKRSIRLADLG